MEAVTEERTKRSYRCGTCNEVGHARSSCPRLAVRRPTRSEQAARLVADTGITMRDAGSQFEVSHQAVQQAWSMLFPGVASPGRQRSAERKRQVLELARGGSTASEIAERLGVSVMLVHYYCRPNGVVLESGLKRKSWTGAIEAVRSGKSLSEAAHEYGLSASRLAIRAKEQGVRSTVSGTANRDGRSIRAAALVESGLTVREACIREQCSDPSVYAALKRRKSR